MTVAMVREEMRLVVRGKGCQDWEMVGEIFMDIVTRREMPDFITTLLSDSYLFKFGLVNNIKNQQKQ